MTKRGPVSGPWNISALRSLALLGFIDFRLNGWCRCRAQTRCNILLGNKHQPGCQREQLLLFRAVSFKGDELEWPGWCNQVGGLKLFTLFTRTEGLIYWIHLIHSPRKNRLPTDSEAALLCFICWYNLLYKARKERTHTGAALVGASLCLSLPVSPVGVCLHCSLAGDWRPCVIFNCPTGEAYLRASRRAAAQSWPANLRDWQLKRYQTSF